MKGQYKSTLIFFFFFKKGPTETVHINFEDENIFEKHLLCAAYENPVSIEVDQVYFGKNIEKGFPSTMIPKDGV